MAEHVSVRQFAALDGCSHTLVNRAVKAGKLPLSADGLIDTALVGSGWRKRNRVETSGGNTATVSTQVPSDPGVSTSPPAAPKKRRGQAGVDAPETVFDLGDEDFVAHVLAGRFRLTGEAERVKENAQAAKSLLAARREAGDVVDIEVAESVLFDQARIIRDAWMNWPVRVGPLIAAELGVSSDAVVEALNKYVQQQLQELGEPDPDFAEPQG